MTGSERRTIGIEAAIGAAINGVLSAAFMVVLFGGRATITADQLRRDALPQTLMVALMSATVPTLLTRKRLGAGKLEPMTAIRHPLPRHLLSRGVVVAVAATLVLVPLQWLALPVVAAGSVAFGRAVAAKIVYGALLGASISALAVRLALGDAGGERR